MYNWILRGEIEGEVLWAWGVEFDLRWYVRSYYCEGNANGDIVMTTLWGAYVSR